MRALRQNLIFAMTTNTRLLSAAAVSIAFAAALSAADITIFDGAKNIGFPAKKCEIKDGALLTARDAEFEGNWDLSKNLDFKFDVENASNTHTLKLKLQICDSKAKTTDFLQRMFLSLKCCRLLVKI